MNLATADITRPLSVLVQLITDELKLAEEAGLEHYVKAGEMLIEAKSQFSQEEIKTGAWKGWLKRNFSHVTKQHAERYMRLVPILESKGSNTAGFTSMRQALGIKDIPGGTKWHNPVQQVLNERTTRAFVENLSKERQSREKEERMMRSLANQLIDIGYKILASKLHPDHRGGSQEAMSRLNKVRKILKEAI